MSLLRRRLPLALLAGLLAAGSVAEGSAAEESAGGAPGIRRVECGQRTCVATTLPSASAAALAARRVTAEEWARVFPVRTAEAAASEPPGPTLFGSYSLDGSQLVFRPRLPFLPETGYRVVLYIEALHRLATLDSGETVGNLGPDPVLAFQLPSPPREAPRVLAIHPSATHIPGNLLRAYVEFSQPMRPDVVADYLRLVDDASREVEMPFVALDGGLWNPGGTRLTLLFHPGRLKRGVAPRQELGPPLEAGRTFRLEIDSGWPGATGEPLTESTSQDWFVGPDDRQPVDPRTWQLDLPQIGTDDPLGVRFGEPLDHALALRLITVRRAGEPVAGDQELSADDSRWAFRPAAPWAEGDYTLRVDPALEDLAGNNLRGVFDRGEGESEAVAAAVEITFRPRP